jgi:hypothetical protein
LSPRSFQDSSSSKYSLTEKLRCLPKDGKNPP